MQQVNTLSAVLNGTGTLSSTDRRLTTEVLKTALTAHSRKAMPLEHAKTFLTVADTVLEGGSSGADSAGVGSVPSSVEALQAAQELVNNIGASAAFGLGCAPGGLGAQAVQLALHPVCGGNGAAKDESLNVAIGGGERRLGDGTSAQASFSLPSSALREHGARGKQVAVVGALWKASPLPGEGLLSPVVEVSAVSRNASSTDGGVGVAVAGVPWVEVTLPLPGTNASGVEKLECRRWSVSHVNWVAENCISTISSAGAMKCRCADLGAFGVFLAVSAEGIVTGVDGLSSKVVGAVDSIIDEQGKTSPVQLLAGLLLATALLGVALLLALMEDQRRPNESDINRAKHLDQVPDLSQATSLSSKSAPTDPSTSEAGADSAYTPSSHGAQCGELSQVVPG